MSTKIMAKCWPIQCTPSQKAVLISLADNANDEGVCWPSVSYIVERTCLCERVVRRVISELEDLQLLTANRVSGKSTSYTLTPALHAPPPLHSEHPCTPSTPAPDAPPPLHQMQDTPAPGAPPYIEPSLNRQITVSDTFNQFWSAYPNKVGKGAAEKSWLKIKPNATLLATILQAIETAKNSAQWKKAGPPPDGKPGDYIPNPATWLNQRRWEDQLTPAAPAPAERREQRFRDVD